MPTYKTDYDQLFCNMSKKYRLKKLLLKSVAICESALDARAYRFEPAFWSRYLKNNPEWKDRDMNEVSASYGLFQLMYTTAHQMGWRGSGEDLYNPVYNAELGAKFIRMLLDKVAENGLSVKFWWLSPIEISLARYNGGRTGNPDSEGKLRRKVYSDKVLRVWTDLKKKEKECDDSA